MHLSFLLFSANFATSHSQILEVISDIYVYTPDTSLLNAISVTENLHDLIATRIIFACTLESDHTNVKNVRKNSIILQLTNVIKTSIAGNDHIPATSVEKNSHV